MKKFIALLTIYAIVGCKTQQKITAKKNIHKDLIGIVNKSSFEKAPYNIWFTKNNNTYTTDKTTISELKKNLKDIKIKGFMGTWCSDSRRETPHFYKVLEEANFNFKNLELIAVNKKKRTPNNLQKGLKIRRVPTFIFYKNGKEIGRYVEYPRETIEKDILKIVSEKPHKH